MIYQIGSQFGLTYDDVRRRHPNTSFAINQPITNFHGVTAYSPTPIPSYDGLRQTVKEVAPVNGQQQWVIEALPQSAVDQNLQNLAASVRAQRNQMLAETDWTQLPDSPVSAAAWANYRQALRDVTAQQGFPENIQWPAKP